jgi:hypothetical protein
MIGSFLSRKAEGEGMSAAEDRGRKTDFGVLEDPSGTSRKTSVKTGSGERAALKATLSKSA